MPSLLHYTVVTDPASLQASRPGAPSSGTVHVIVSNTHQSDVRWEFIDVEIPVGSGPGDLTDNPAAISASVDKDYSAWREEEPEFGWDAGLGRFRAHAPSGGRLTLPDHESLVLKLDGIPVSGAEGLVRLRVHEKSGGGDDNIAMRRDHCTTTLGLVKQAPRTPCNFRPEKRSLADADAGENVVLKWDGPDNLDYWIRDPEGNEVLAQSAGQGPGVTQRTYAWSPPVAPRRGTTYTLVAGTAGSGQQQQGYFLTTTVHARVPEFESGTRTPWVEGTSDRGRATFSAEGVEIRNQSHGWGTVAAEKADVNGVNTKWVQGRDADDGWIEFPHTGLNVFHGQHREWGTLAADKADLNDLLTGQGRVKGQLVVEGGLNVSHESGPLLSTLPDRILFHGINEFKQWVTFADGLAVTYSKTGSVWISKDAKGLIVNGDLQVQQGGISVSTGNPPQVRSL